MSEKKVAPLEELDWIRIRKRQTATLREEELLWDKLKRKMLAHPAIPIGAAATVGALSFGLYNFCRGNSMMSQYMMRLRVATQTFTLLAVMFAMHQTGATSIFNRKESVEATSATESKTEE